MESEGVVVAAVQLCATADRKANLERAEGLVALAARRGAGLVVLPEMWGFIGDEDDKVHNAEELGGASMTAAAQWARTHGIWLHAGSFAERCPEPRRVWNTSVVFDPEGAARAVYRKIHLFDIDVPGGVTARESDTVAPGDRAVVVSTPWGTFGLAICYDLRFPALFASLRSAGAEAILLPAAFTAHTGKDHWEVLLRARAIEQQCWVVAPNQGGWHNKIRQSHGHSMIIDPWGLVVARASDGPGLSVAELDVARARRVRAELPCGQQRRFFHEAASTAMSSKGLA
jgi:predicted amidohydrolase